MPDQVIPLNLSNDQITASKEKCHICSKEFDQYNLEIHLVEDHDSNEGPYICDICGQYFKKRHAMIVHQESVHAGIRKIKCELCDKVLDNPYSLSIHKKVVHDSKLWAKSCGLCEKHL